MKKNNNKKKKEKKDKQNFKDISLYLEVFKFEYEASKSRKTILENKAYLLGTVLFFLFHLITIFLFFLIIIKIFMKRRLLL